VSITRLQKGHWKSDHSTMVTFASGLPCCGALPSATLKIWSDPGGGAAGAAVAATCGALRMGVPRPLPLEPMCWPTAKPATAPTQTPMNTFQLLFTWKVPFVRCPTAGCETIM